MRKVDWNNVQEAQDFPRLSPGGYIARIERVDDVEENEYLRVEFDIADGEFKDYYMRLYRARQFWGGVLIRSYKEKALPFFKAFKTALEVSNPRYEFDESRLDDMRGKYIGVVLAEEEYRANDGTVKTRIYCAQTRAVKAIQTGDYKVPDLKKLADTRASAPSYKNSGGFADADIEDDGDLPF